MTPAPPDHEAIAAEALAAIDDARQIAPFSARYPSLTLDDAYRIAARLCALRTARGFPGSLSVRFDGRRQCPQSTLKSGEFTAILAGRILESRRMGGEEGEARLISLYEWLLDPGAVLLLLAA